MAQLIREVFSSGVRYNMALRELLSDAFQNGVRVQELEELRRSFRTKKEDLTIEISKLQKRLAHHTGTRGCGSSRIWLIFADP